MEEGWQIALETERLRLSSPDTVYAHLSALPKGSWGQPNLPDTTFDALTARNEPLIDLGLARYASNHKKLRVFLQRGGLLRLAVLANEAAWDAALQSPLSAEEIAEVHRDGTNDELAALFQNRSIDPTVLAGAIANTLGGGVDEGRWQNIVGYASKNQRLTCTLDSDAFDDLVIARHHEEPINAAWDLLWRVEPTFVWASVLYYLLSRIPFEVTMRDEFVADLIAEEGRKEWHKTFERRWSRYLDAFVEMVTTKWVNPDPKEKEWDYWRSVRQVFASKLIESRWFDKDLVDKLRDHPDQAIRCGYYLGFCIDPKWPISEFHERDGDKFLEAVVENNHLYRRINRDLQSTVRGMLFGVDSSRDYLPGRFRHMQYYWAQKDPINYGDEPTLEQAEAERRAQEEEASLDARKEARLAASTTQPTAPKPRSFAAPEFWIGVVIATVVLWVAGRVFR